MRGGWGDPVDRADDPGGKLNDQSTSRPRPTFRLVLALTLGLVVGMVTGPTTGPAHHGPRCDIAWERGPQAVRRLVVCVAKELPDVDVATALRVAGCESGFRPRALSPSRKYGGVYQQEIDRWPARARLHGFPGAEWFDAEANVWVSLRAVRYGGWGPWSCA